MKSIYKKEIKTYLNSTLTYIFLMLLIIIYSILFSNRIFLKSSYYTNVINYELPMYNLTPWIISLIPMLMFLTYKVQKGKRVDTHLYVSILPSYKIVLAKILAISTIFVVPLLLILLVNIILFLTIFKASAMVLSIYALMFLNILLSASFNTFMYTLFKNPIIALIVSIVLQGLLMIFMSIFTSLAQTLFLPYLQGLLPLGITLMLVCLIIVFILVSTMILNKKRNIV